MALRSMKSVPPNRSPWNSTTAAAMFSQHRIVCACSSCFSSGRPATTTKLVKLGGRCNSS